MNRNLKNPVSGVDVEVLVSSFESEGKLFRIRSTMRANQLNKAPYHYHKNFIEHFKVVKGQLNMIVGNNRRELTLCEGESYLVEALCPHTFWNSSNSPVTYTVDVEPAEQFEQALRINHALAAKGLASSKGTPANIFHIAILAKLGNTWFYGIPQWIQSGIFTIFATIGRIIGVERKLYKLID